MLAAPDARPGAAGNTRVQPHVGVAGGLQARGAGWESAQAEGCNRREASEHKQE